MRRAVYVLVLIGLLAVIGVAANGGFEVRGQVSANDTEVEEGYFALTQDTMLMVRPGSPLHHWLKANKGRAVRVVLEPADTQ